MKFLARTNTFEANYFFLLVMLFDVFCFRGLSNAFDLYENLKFVK